MNNLTTIERVKIGMLEIDLSNDDLDVSSIRELVEDGVCDGCLSWDLIVKFKDDIIYTQTGVGTDTIADLATYCCDIYRSGVEYGRKLAQLTNTKNVNDNSNIE